MIGRADIEESKSNVAMNAWLPQASYPCGNFSDTSSLKLKNVKGRTKSRPLKFLGYYLHHPKGTPEIVLALELILSQGPLGGASNAQSPTHIGRWFDPSPMGKLIAFLMLAERTSTSENLCTLTDL